MKAWLFQSWKWFWENYSTADPVGRILLISIPAASFIFFLNFVTAWARENSEAGAFGDSFGIATSLFSGAAFAMLVVSIWLQRKELDIVREERDETRKILSNQQALADEQRRALKNQIDLSRKKAREDQFFAMANLIANELQRLNDKTAHNRTYLSDAFSVVLRIVERDGELHWDEIKEKNGNHAIYQCMPVCKLFGAAYAVARDLGPDREHTARDVLRALAGDQFIQIYACIVKLRGEHKSQMSSAYHELHLSDLLLGPDKVRLERAIDR